MSAGGCGIAARPPAPVICRLLSPPPDPASPDPPGMIPPKESLTPKVQREAGAPLSPAPASEVSGHGRKPLAENLSNAPPAIIKAANDRAALRQVRPLRPMPLLFPSQHCGQAPWHRSQHTLPALRASTEPHFHHPRSGSSTFRRRAPSGLPSSSSTTSTRRSS